MTQSQRKEVAPKGFDDEGWPLPEVRSMMVDNFTRSWLKHWVATIAIFVLAFALIMFSALLVDPRWEGTAALQIKPEPKLIMGTGTESILRDPEPVTVAAMVKTITEQITDRPLLEEVVDATYQYEIRRRGREPEVRTLTLSEYFELRANEEATWRTNVKKRLAYFVTLRFLRPAADVNWRIKALEELEARWILVAPLEGTVRIDVAIYGDTPQMTTQVGDTLLSTLIARLNEERRAEVQRHVGWLNDQVAKAQGELSATESKMLAARQALGVFNASAAAEQTGNVLSDLRQQRATLPLQAETLQAQIAKLQSELETTPEFIELARSSEDTLIGPTVQSLESTLSRVRSELEGLKTRLSPTSSEIKQKEAEIRSLEADLAKMQEADGTRDRTGMQMITEINRKYQSLWDRWQDALVQQTVLQARSAGLEAVITELESTQKTAIAADLELQRLNRQQREQEVHLASLRQQLLGFETLADQPILRNDVIVDPATSVANPAQSDYPNMLLIFIIAVALGLFAALVLPVAYDYLNQTLLSSRQATAVPGLRLVAVVPSMRSGSMFKPASS